MNRRTGAAGAAVLSRSAKTLGSIPWQSPATNIPQGRWFTNSAWGRQRLKKEIPNDAELIAYLKPQWRWIGALQNDFAARADWCVKEFAEANHAPVVKVDGALTREVKPGETVKLAATATDPDGDKLTFQWWQYSEADSAAATVTIAGSDSARRGQLHRARANPASRFTSFSK